MPRSLKLYIAGLVAVSVATLVATSLVFGLDSRIAIEFDGHPGTSSIELGAGLGFWILASLLAWALPVQTPRGVLIAFSLAPCIAAINLGGPAAGAWVGLIGTTEYREIRGRIPWYGTLANHAGIVIPAALGGVVMAVIGRGGGNVAFDFARTLAGSIVYISLNLVLASGLLAARSNSSFKSVLLGDARGVAPNFYAVAPLAWLMAQVYQMPGAGWWATLLFALPLYTTRLAYHRVVEMREMFTQTIGALAGAVDKRDPFTSRHSQRVKQIAVDIGKVMRVSEADLEALEWGGLLHDVGKIGVPDAILLKQSKLTREERMKMNAHPVLGAEIIEPVARLAPELPIIRHHHEWYNGSGYPDRLMGAEIPRLARILHVADAFEAMTAARPYRMVPLTAEQALAELSKFAGVQFDPVVVDAFVKTPWVEGVSDPGQPFEPRPIPLIATAAARMAKAAAAEHPKADSYRG